MISLDRLSYIREKVRAQRTHFDGHMMLAVEVKDRAHLEELEFLLGESERLRADNERLRMILQDLRPDIERLEFCEASAEDGNTARLQMLRHALREGKE